MNAVPGSETPKVRSVFVRWQVECDECGILDSGIKWKGYALDIERTHRQVHLAVASAKAEGGGK